MELTRWMDELTQYKPDKKFCRKNETSREQTLVALFTDEIDGSNERNWFTECL